MQFIYISLLFLMILNGCSQEPTFNPSNKHIYNQGYKDGCKTANGNYTKKHKLFQNNLDYHEGWFGGRKECNH